jgi:RNA polymerase sigma-70 factor (ECF subfamily)
MPGNRSEATMSIARHTDFNAELTFDALFARERARIVRLCAHLTGDAEAAEDLAQEAMIEAWRTSIRLSDPADLAAWLTGCARNVCQRWLRKRGRELSHRAQITIESAETIAPSAVTDAADLDLELERDDLATLLDRALTLLPADTREALIQHYIEQRSHAEIADLLGSTENAVTVRLHRGRLAFRKALSSPELRPLSTAFGLAIDPDSDWQETRIWCHECGMHRMIARFFDGHSGFQIKCPVCHDFPGFPPGVYMTNISGIGWLLDGISSFKPASNRASEFMSNTYRRYLEDGVAHCLRCGAETPLIDGKPDFLPEEFRSMIGKHYFCQACGGRSDSSLAGLVIVMPEVRAFWKANPRIRRLPDREIEVDGHPAIVTGYESVSDGASIEIVSKRDDFRTLRINGERPGGR